MVHKILNEQNPGGKVLASTRPRRITRCPQWQDSPGGQPPTRRGGEAGLDPGCRPPAQRPEWGQRDGGERPGSRGPGRRWPCVFCAPCAGPFPLLPKRTKTRGHDWPQAAATWRRCGPSRSLPPAEECRGPTGSGSCGLRTRAQEAATPLGVGSLLACACCVRPAPLAPSAASEPEPRRGGALTRRSPREGRAWKPARGAHCHAGAGRGYTARPGPHRPPGATPPARGYTAHPGPHRTPGGTPGATPHARVYTARPSLHHLPESTPPVQVYVTPPKPPAEVFVPRSATGPCGVRGLSCPAHTSPTGRCRPDVGPVCPSPGEGAGSGVSGGALYR